MFQQTYTKQGPCRRSGVSVGGVAVGWFDLDRRGPAMWDYGSIFVIVEKITISGIEAGALN